MSWRSARCTASTSRRSTSAAPTSGSPGTWKAPSAAAAGRHEPHSPTAEPAPSHPWDPIPKSARWQDSVDGPAAGTSSAWRPAVSLSESGMPTVGYGRLWRDVHKPRLGKLADASEIARVGAFERLAGGRRKDDN